MGPRTEPWGTSEESEHQSEMAPLNTTCCFRCKRKSQIHWRRKSLMPIEWSFVSNRLWSTLSNAELKSKKIPSTSLHLRSSGVLQSIDERIWPTFAHNFYHCRNQTDYQTKYHAPVNWNLEPTLKVRCWLDIWCWPNLISIQNIWTGTRFRVHLFAFFSHLPIQFSESCGEYWHNNFVMMANLDLVENESMSIIMKTWGVQGKYWQLHKFQRFVKSG